MHIKIKYFNKDMPRLNKIEKGDWIDLRVNEVCVCKNNEEVIKNAIKNRQITEWENGSISYDWGFVLIARLGVAMKLPDNYEAELKSRSSTFPTYGFYLTNGVGCIDETYCGNNDEWLAVFYLTRSGTISQFDRVCQFRINEKMDIVKFDEVDFLENDDRDGFGSTGTK